MINLDHTEYNHLPRMSRSPQNLHLESTLQDLSLYNVNIEIDQKGEILNQLLEFYGTLPGVILKEQGKFVGMISQRRFFEKLSRPYARELFLGRSLRVLYQFAQMELLVLPGTTSVVEAAERAIQRPPDLLYEPLVVQISSNDFRVLDTQQLMIAQSCIHQLATELLREKTQAQLIQTEKLATLGQMLAGVSHEIRNPVACILGNYQHLANYYKDLMNLIQIYEQELNQSSENIEEYKEEIEFDFLRKDLPELLQSIELASKRLSHLVENLRTFSRTDSSKREKVNIHHCLDNSLLILKSRLKSGIKVIKNYGNIPIIYGYSNQLMQVFLNLISNAVDALEDIGQERDELATIWIDTQIRDCSLEEKIQLKMMNDCCPINPSQISQSSYSEETNSAVHVALQNSSINYQSEALEELPCCVSIRIADNGPGIPPAIQQQIFDNYFTTKPAGKGTGLGLSITHQIVTEKHRGQLNLKSKVGRGTEFEILLPIS